MTIQRRAGGRRWRIELLGSLRVARGEQIVERFRHQKAAALLAYLALVQSTSPQPERPHPREELVEQLWPEIDPELGRGKLRFMLHALRRQLEPLGDAAPRLLIAERSTLRLDPAAFTTDVAEFLAAAQAAADTPEPGERAQWLLQAASQYRGELLPGFFEPWVLTERAHLAERHLELLGQLAAALEQAGDLEGALRYARQVVSLDPLREEAHYALMRLYAAAGQPAATLQQYQELERLLREELGEAPSAASRALVEELRQSARQVMAARTASPAALPAVPAPRFAPPVPAPPARLPVQFTRFFGREEEIARVSEALRIPETRLVTLTGPGGCGKTRLAIAIAGRLQEPLAGDAPARSDGPWFVPLADLSEARLVPEAIVGALGLPRPSPAEPLDQAVCALQAIQSAAGRPGGSPMLLVLDNFEQLVEEGASIVRALLERVPQLTCLVTSRQRLELAGEQEYVVPPLPVPGDQGAGCRVKGGGGRVTEYGPYPLHPTPYTLMQFPSIQLFVDRAQAARPGFQLTAENAAAVAALCSRLEGLPLALELAAAWAGVLTPPQMLPRLEQRFALLVSQSRDVPGRHRSLRAALEWSYQLLSPELQRCLAGLSVFRGGWSLEAAEIVGAEPAMLVCLRQLRERSLVVVDEVEGAMRYRLLETVRDFAAEQLTPEEQARLGRCHAEYFLAWADAAYSHADHVDEEAGLARMDREQENLRAALAWSQSAAEDGLALALHLGGVLGWFWSARSHLKEGRAELERLLALEAASRPADPPSPSDDRQVARARLLAFAGLLAFDQGDYAAVRAAFQECLALYRQAGLWLKANYALMYLGAEARERGDLDLATAYFEEVLVIERQHAAKADTRASIALGLGNLGSVALLREDLAAARHHYEESHALYAALNDKRGCAWALHELAAIARLSDDRATARALAEQSLSLRHELRSPNEIASSLLSFAELARSQGQPERAARLFGAAAALREAIGSVLPPHEHPAHDRALTELRAALGGERFEEAWRAGQALTLEQAVAEALDRTETASPDAALPPKKNAE